MGLTITVWKNLRSCAEAHVLETIPSAISHTCTNSNVKVRIQRRLCPGKCSQVL